MDKSNSESQTKDILGNIRQDITALDRELLGLLAKRRSLSLEVAKYKASSNKPIRDRMREKELLDGLIEAGNQTGLDGEYLTKLYHVIFEDSLLVQQKYLKAQPISNPFAGKETTVAVLGGLGAYSYLAAAKHFNLGENSYNGCSTFLEVFQSVEQGKSEFGVLPIENTTSGGITEVYDLLLETNLMVIGEVKLPINHCLIVKPNTSLNKVTKIFAHPEASKQCNKNLPQQSQAEICLVSSTAEALKQTAESSDKNVAAIGSELAAEQFGLKVVLRNIANLKENTTRFLVLAKQPQTVAIEVPCKTTIAISTAQKPGSLAEVLVAFKSANIPLCKLESRPIPGRPWEQMFYIDFLGNIDDPDVKGALKKIESLCLFVKVLGTYATDDLNPL